MKRVLFTVDAVGGVWRYCMDLAAELAAEGTSVSFLGFGPEPDAAQRREAEALGALFWSELPLDWMVDRPEALSGVGARIVDAASWSGATLLHLNLPSQAAGLRTSLPVVAMSHSCLATWFAQVRREPAPPGFGWHRDLTAAGLRRADAVIAPSRSHASALTRCYGEIGPVRVVPNATRITPEVVAREAFICAAGRWWDDGKNVRLLDDAAPSAPWPIRLIGATRGPDGAGPQLRHLESRQLSHAQTLAEIARAGIFASPSLYEPFGLAVLEAARHGAPLVLADIPTFRELWRNAALFFDPRSPAQFVECVNRLAQAPALRSELGARARRQAESYSPARQARATRCVHARAMAPLLALQAE